MSHRDADEQVCRVIGDHLVTIGYPQERLHSGLLASICNWGDPLDEFLSRLELDGFRGRKFKPSYEKHQIDLVLECKRDPSFKIGFEFKVDANTTAKQLKRYVEHVDQLVLVTLGMAEAMAVYELPRKAVHVGLDQWATALDAVTQRCDDSARRSLFSAYLAMYRREQGDRACVSSDELNQPRHAFGRIELLGRLARALRADLAELQLDCEVKTYGNQGDVTYTVWLGSWDLYLEVNTSGKLSLKAMEVLNRNSQDLDEIVERFDSEGFVRRRGMWPTRNGKPTKTATLGFWEFSPDLWLQLVNDVNGPCERIRRVLRLYADARGSSLPTSGPSS